MRQCLTGCLPQGAQLWHLAQCLAALPLAIQPAGQLRHRHQGQIAGGACEAVQAENGLFLIHILDALGRGRGYLLAAATSR